MAAIDPALTRLVANLDHSYESIDRIEAKFDPGLATPIAKYLGDVVVARTGASWMATAEPEVGKLPYLGKTHFVPSRAVASFAALRIPGDLRENTERYDLKARRAMVAALNERKLDLDALGKALGVKVPKASYDVFETIQTTVAPGTKLDLAALRAIVVEGSLLAAELARAAKHPSTWTLDEVPKSSSFGHPVLFESQAPGMWIRRCMRKGAPKGFLAGAVREMVEE